MPADEKNVSRRDFLAAGVRGAGVLALGGAYLVVRILVRFGAPLLLGGALARRGIDAIAAWRGWR